MRANKLARRNHPETSHEAARYAMSVLGDRQREAFYAVKQHPGKTVSELAKLHNHRDIRRFGRRLPELEKAGLVLRGSARTCSVTGRNAGTWYLVDVLENQPRTVKRLSDLTVGTICRDGEREMIVVGIGKPSTYKQAMIGLKEKQNIYYEVPLEKLFGWEILN